MVVVYSEPGWHDVCMEHHALLYVGSPETLSDILPGDVLLQGADIRHFVLEQFGIDDARTLSRESSRRPV